MLHTLVALLQHALALVHLFPGDVPDAGAG